MRKLTSLAALLALCLSSAAFAAPAADGGFTETRPAATGGGYTGNMPTLTTVAKAKEMADDTRVQLKGKITKHIRSDHYEFQDASGTVEVEIDHKVWAGQTVSPQDMVEISGKVDKDAWSTKTEIDVKRLQLVK